MFWNVVLFLIWTGDLLAIVIDLYLYINNTTYLKIKIYFFQALSH